MSTSTLPKPFKPENVTNSNVNEKIINFMLKKSVTMDYDGDKSKNIKAYLEKYLPRFNYDEYCSDGMGTRDTRGIFRY